jgi:hypothetical protein
MCALRLKTHEARRLEHLRTARQGRQPPVTKEQVAEIRALIGIIPYSKIQIEYPVSNRLITSIKQGRYDGY